MALIIKGDMPTSCERCPFNEHWWKSSWDYGERCRLTGTSTECTSRPSDCPIIGEILDEHGVLGDISDLAMSLYSELETQEIKTLDDVMKIIKKVFDNAPVVVEASK